MGRSLQLDPQRFFPSDSKVRSIAARLFGAVETLPILSPHGHTDPRWFAGNEPFEDAGAKLVATHRLDEDEAGEVAVELAYRLAKSAYRL